MRAQTGRTAIATLAGLGGLAFGFGAGVHTSQPARAEVKVQPVCPEDAAIVVAPARIGDTVGQLRWVCVTLDDFADKESIARLDAILSRPDVTCDTFETEELTCVDGNTGEQIYP